MKAKYPLAALLACFSLVGLARADEPSFVDKTKAAVERGAQATAHGIERGARATGHGIEVGLTAAGHGLKRGAEATSRALHTVANKIRGSENG